MALSAWGASRPSSLISLRRSMREYSATKRLLAMRRRQIADATASGLLAEKCL